MASHLVLRYRFKGANLYPGLHQTLLAGFMRSGPQTNCLHFPPFIGFDKAASAT